MTKSRRPFRFLKNLLFGPLPLAMAVCLLARAAAADCTTGSLAAAGANAVSVNALAWAPFGRAEIGWGIYEALIAREIGSTCAASTPAFAAAVARWQGAHGHRPSGIVDAAAFTRMKVAWQNRRPFVAQSRHACPFAPTAAGLAQADAHASYGGKIILLTPGALAAYRQMAAAARRDLPEARHDERLLTIFSGFRSPEYDAARCATELNCQGLVRASCSAHRTGKALDLYLGAAPGYGPDSSADINRLYVSHSATYRWLVMNAPRFGFTNYAFEPWHWEWTG
jgi:D-alanyl-D-alanine carboxypeptidase